MSTELMEKTKTIIGEGDPDYDWKIVPTQHADHYRESAPELATILKSTKVNGLATRYEEFNREAIEARDRFKSTIKKANGAIFITAVFGALLLLGTGVQKLFADWDQLTTIEWTIRVISILGILSSGLAYMWLRDVQGGRLLKDWRESRARAEAKRLVYFKEVMQGAQEEVKDQLLVMEYTRRFLLDNQLDYFKQRGEQHEERARKAYQTESRALFIASSITGIASVLALWQPTFAVIAGLGVIATAYAAYARSGTEVNLDMVNADKYRKAEDLLWERKLDLDDFRQKVIQQEQGAVIAFFEPIFVLLEADHKSFLSDAEKQEAAIGEMEKRLKKADQMREKNKDGGDDD